MYNQQNYMDDIQDDLDELLYHTETELSRISRFQKILGAQSSAVRPETISLINNLVHEPLAAYTALRAEIIDAKKTNSDSTALKQKAADLLRTLQGVTGALLAAADWQSPSYLHALYSKAGAQNGKIEGTINDYKRDRHLDAERYEHAFRSEYIDAAFRIPPSVMLTSSGMSAFTTIINCLHLDGLINGPVVAGVSSYFESKKILESFFPENLYYVDEMDVENLLAVVHEVQPAVIFLDTLCNTESIALPDIETIITRLAATLTRPTTLVLDNTGLGIMCQPLKYLPLLPGKLHLIVFESLLKYHQFGFDRVSGGIIWTSGISPYRLSGWRMHLGTNIPDASVLSLPEPNRMLLKKRMARMDRNATFLANAINTYITRPESSGPFSHVVYPGLPSYPGYAWTHELPFHGSYFVLALKSRYPQVMVCKMFISLVIDEAKKQGIDVVAGTSFGFSTTRIYLTALHADKITKPFLRISVGTETQSEVEQLAKIFIKAIDQLSVRVII